MKVVLRNGEPKSWSRIDMKMTENARPTYSGEPNGSTTSPFSLQSCGPKPIAACFDSLFSAQKTPPPTYLIPAPMSEPPMSMTAVPTTTGGNSFLRYLGGIIARPISKNAATMHVPRKRP